MAVTLRQREVLDFISQFIAMNRYSPSYEEIGAGVGLTSLATVHKHIHNLKRKGLLSASYNRSRSIDLTDGICPSCGQKRRRMAL